MGVLWVLCGFYKSECLLLKQSIKTPTTSCYLTVFCFASLKRNSLIRIKLFAFLSASFDGFTLS